MTGSYEQIPDEKKQNTAELERVMKRWDEMVEADRLDRYGHNAEEFLTQLASEKNADGTPKNEAALLWLYQNGKIDSKSNCLVKAAWGPATEDLLTFSIANNLCKLVEVMVKKEGCKFPVITDTHTPSIPELEAIKSASGKMLLVLHELMGADINSPHWMFKPGRGEPGANESGEIQIKAITPLTRFAMNGQVADVIAALDGGIIDITTKNLGISNVENLDTNPVKFSGSDDGDESQEFTILQVLSDTVLAKGAIIATKNMELQNKYMEILASLVQHGASTEGLETLFAAWQAKQSIDSAKVDNVISMIEQALQNKDKVADELDELSGSSQKFKALTTKGMSGITGKTILSYLFEERPKKTPDTSADVIDEKKSSSSPDPKGPR